MKIGELIVALCEDCAEVEEKVKEELVVYQVVG